MSTDWQGTLEMDRKKQPGPCTRLEALSKIGNIRFGKVVSNALACRQTKHTPSQSKHLQKMQKK